MKDPLSYEFEIYARENGYYLSVNNGEYTNPITKALWELWQHKSGDDAKITKPCRVGGGVFRPGISVSTVIKAAERNYIYSAENPTQAPLAVPEIRKYILGTHAILPKQPIQAMIDLGADILILDKEKLAAAQEKHGFNDDWLKTDWMDACQDDLLRHIDKGDPVDVASYCMFMHHHGWKTKPKTLSESAQYQGLLLGTHVIVPKQPTNEMMYAFMDNVKVKHNDENDPFAYAVEYDNNAYEAMIKISQSEEYESKNTWIYPEASKENEFFKNKCPECNSNNHIKIKAISVENIKPNDLAECDRCVGVKGKVCFYGGDLCIEWDNQ